MKIRNSFVSNSSSSSFVIGREYFSVKLLYCLQNPEEILSMAHEFGNGLIWENDPDPICEIEAWSITDNYNSGNIEFSVFMDNFDMEEFLIKCGIPKEVIKEKNHGHW